MKREAWILTESSTYGVTFVNDLVSCFLYYITLYNINSFG